MGFFRLCQELEERAVREELAKRLERIEELQDFIQTHARLPTLDELLTPQVKASSSKRPPALQAHPERESEVVVFRDGERPRIQKLRPSHIEFLRTLEKDGQAELHRGEKQNLIQRIPELKPWITTAGVSGRQLKSGDNAVYSVDPEVRQRIRLSVP